MKSQERPRRKVSGSRYVNFRKKKFALMGRDPTLSKVGERKVKNLRGRGGGKKEILYSINYLMFLIRNLRNMRKLRLRM